MSNFAFFGAAHSRFGGRARARIGSMTDLSELGTSKGGITNPARICSRHDRVADSVEISGKDDSVTNFTCEERDQASPKRG